MEILWKGTVSANCPKLCGKGVFPQNFQTRKLGKVTVFFTVKDISGGKIKKLHYKANRIISSGAFSFPFLYYYPSLNVSNNPFGLFWKCLSRSSRPEAFCKKGVLGNFAKCTGKHLWQGLFFNKEAWGLQLY